MKQNNQDLRMLARGKDVPLWKVAAALGVSEPTLFRHWREELPEEKKAQVRQIIESLAEGAE